MSNKEEMQASVSVLEQDNVWEVEKKNFHLVRRVERQAAASSKRHRAAEQESQEDSFSCRSLDGSTNYLGMRHKWI